MKKLILRSILSGLMCVFLCGCTKHSAAYSAEYYYLYPQFMKAAGVTKRIATVYIPDNDKVYTSVEDVIAKVSPAASKNVTSCDFSAGVCEAFSLNEGSEEKVGAVTYTYRYNEKKMAISRSGNNVFTEYQYTDGKLTSLADYEGTGKTADSVPLRTIQFDYDANGHGTHSKLTENTTDPVSAYDYTMEYDDSGRLIRINTMMAGVFKGHTVLTYNEKGLIVTSTVYAIVSEDKEKILTYTEYTYE